VRAPLVIRTAVAGTSPLISALSEFAIMTYRTLGPVLLHKIRGVNCGLDKMWHRTVCRTGGRLEL
jgi:hypothetical protein